MIVPMLKVLVVGPKPLMPDVIGTIQRMGRVHLSSGRGDTGGVSASQLSPAEGEQKLLLEKAAAEIDALLSLLGYRGAPAPAAAPDWAVLEPRLRGQQEQARALVRQRLELEDELALIASYQQAFEALSPLMSRLEGSARIRAFGFIIKGGDTTVADPIRRELKKATAGRCELYAQALGDGRVAAMVAYHVSDADRVHGFFSKLGVNELRLPSTVAGLPMPEAVRQLKQKLRDLPGRIRQAQTDVRALADQWGPELAGLRQQAADILARLNARGQIDESRFTFLLQGFLPQGDLSRLQDTLRSKYQETVTVQVIEIGHRDAPTVPVILKNNPVVRPFELLLSIFNPPQYGTVDPTPFIAFFFPLYFGFIIGDIGYGLIMLAAAFLVMRKYKNVALARSITTIFIICSL
jgi:V/A-type H+/Na+-transporting ATPase subunit I